MASDYSHLVAQPPFSGTRWQRMALPAVVAVGALGACVVLHFADPNDEGTYPACPFLAVTGLYCPGCGSMRTLRALSHADLPTALARNPLAVVAYVWVAGIFLAWTRRRWSNKHRSYLAPPWVLWTVLGVILAFWVLRNIPGWDFLSPL